MWVWSLATASTAAALLHFQSCPTNSLKVGETTEAPLLGDTETPTHLRLDVK